MLSETVRKIVSGILTAIIILIALLLCMAFGYMPPDPPIPESGVEVSLGNSDMGFGDAETPDKQPASAAPAPQPAAANNEYATQNTEQSLSMPSKVSKTPSNKQQQEQEKAKPAEKEQPKEPEINNNALFKKRNNTNNSDGGSKGNTTGEGAMGKDNGNPNATGFNGNGGNGANGNGIGYSLVGRKALGLPEPKYSSQAQGKVVITILVDRNGKVVSAENSRGTNINDQQLINQCIIAAKKAQFNASETAVEKQKGTITYVFSRTN